MEMHLNVGFVAILSVGKMQAANYKIPSSFMSALFVFPPPVHFMFASSKMFGAIKG